MKNRENEMVLVYIAFGSNLGNRIDHVRQMTSELEYIGGATMRCSSLWLSEATEMDSDAGDFVNGVIELKTKLSALALLDRLQQIEVAMGRPADHGFHTARVIDLDIICYGNQVISTPRLTVPHPRAHERAFVLNPLFELAPELKLPGLDQSLSEMIGKAPPMKILQLPPNQAEKNGSLA